MNPDIKTITEINGVMLTPECIKCLQDLQSENNSILNLIQSNISNSISYILDFDPQSEQYREQLDIVKGLNFVVMFIKDLKKP